jgi:hypothetical protein
MYRPTFSGSENMVVNIISGPKIREVKVRENRIDRRLVKTG